MKGLTIVDIPVDDPVEIDEYGMVADLKIWPMTLTKREDLFFELEHVDIRPIPQKLEYKGIEDDNIEISKAIAKSSWYRFAKPNEAIEFRSFAEGYNYCIDEILRKFGEEE